MNLQWISLSCVNFTPYQLDDRVLMSKWVASLVEGYNIIKSESIRIIKPNNPNVPIVFERVHHFIQNDASLY